MAADLGPPLSAEGWPRRDHQVSVEVLEDLDLGTLGIPPQQVVQPLELAHDPRGVHPGRRERRCLEVGQCALNRVGLDQQMGA